MAKNPIFGRATYNSRSARQLRGRVELGSIDVMAEMNTYKNFGIFHTWNDVYSQAWKSTDDPTDADGDPNSGQVPGTPGVRSLFNKYSAVLTGTDQGLGNFDGGPMSESIKNLVIKSSGWRISNNVPLIDTPKNREKIQANSGCTVRELVQASQKGHFGVATYSYADFMYCKYLNKVPNNYLITLRRFPTPVLDSIMPSGTGTDRHQAGANDQIPPMGTMVTWLGVSGNDMKSILKYSYNMDYQQVDAKWENVQPEGESPNSPLTALEAMMNPAARKQYTDGTSVPALDSYMQKFFGAGASPYQQKTGQEDEGRLYGPIDRVKSTYIRGTKGLTFDQTITLVFEYELRSYNGINPRQAMLDLIASILSTTYTTGGFWKGGYRGGGVRQSSYFRNLNIFKQPASLPDLWDNLHKDVQNAWGKIKDASAAAGGPMKLLGNAVNAIGSLIAAGMVNNLGRPARYAQNSLITPEPTGLWHVTIGNPHHPIMMMGNMVLKKTEIEHSGPLGLDDFPTHLKVTCTLERGKPRDQYGIENMYMQGNDRIFHSMEGKIVDMYDAAKEYSKNKAAVPAETSKVKFSANNDAMTQGVQQGGKQKSDGSTTPEGEATAKKVKTQIHQYTEYSDQWLYYFGMKSGADIISSSGELNRGTFKKSKPTDPNKSKAQDPAPETKAK